VEEDVEELDAIRNQDTIELEEDISSGMFKLFYLKIEII
jgi:hypothetical protein